MNDINQTHEDTGMIHWPSDVREAYGKLKLPSLYEIVLSNEKMALEIRKQNKEIKALHDKLHEVQEEQTSREESLREEKSNEIREIEKVLISLMDSMHQLQIATHKITDNVLNTLPSNSWWPFTINQIKNNTIPILQSYMDGVKMMIDKLQLYFEKASIEPIMPNKGDLFTPQLHNAVEMCSGGKAGEIAEVVRIGYQRTHGQIIRYADVKIYKQKN